MNEVILKKGDEKIKSLQNACTFLFSSSSKPGQKEHTSEGVKLNIHGSAELTALPSGIRSAAGEALSKLQCEHILMDTQSPNKTVSP